MYFLLLVLFTHNDIYNDTVLSLKSWVLVTT